MGSVQAKESSKKPGSVNEQYSSSSGNNAKDVKVRDSQEGHQAGSNKQGKTFKDIKARVDKVNIEGLGRTKNDLVVESLKPLFAAGNFFEVYTRAHEIRERLNSLGCFSNVGVYIDTSAGSNATPDGLEVTFQVNELRRITAFIKTLFGSNNEGSVALSMSLPNLMGRGERIDAEYSYGNRRTSDINLGFAKPLRGRTNAFFTSSVFQRYSEQPWSGYKEIDRGLLFDLALTSAPLVRHNLQWETTWRDLSVLNRTTAFEIREMSGPSLKGSLRHILSVDRRDHPIFPHSGTLLRLTTEYAGIGGNVNFLKNEVQFQANAPLTDDVVFQASFYGGLLKSLGNKPTSLCDNFFLGGPMSLRGFETRGVGPQAGRNAIGASEENVWKMCEDVAKRLPTELQHCYVVFVSNKARTIPLWRQRAGETEDKLVIYDYHAMLLYMPPGERCVVYDLDSELPFPTHFHKYVTETFRTDQVLDPDYFRYFRVVPAASYLQNFASDRRHWRKADNTWLKAPPSYPPINTSVCSHNMDQYVDMDQSKGPGQVLNLTQIVERFYQQSTSS